MTRAGVFTIVVVIVVLAGVSYAAIGPSSGSSSDAQKTAVAGSSNKTTFPTPSQMKAAADAHPVLANKKANTVDSKSLQAGKYLLKSDGQISNTLPPYKTARQTECGIYNGSKMLASADAFNGAYDDKNPEESAAAFESVSMEATVTLKSASTVTLKCDPKDGSTRASMSLTATRVDK